MTENGTLVGVAVAITNVAVALGTLYLALIAKRSLQEGRRQLKILSSQTEIFRSQQDPFLKVNTFRFEGDKLLLDVENIGNGPATWVGVETWFEPTFPRTFADEDSTVPISAGEAASKVGKGEKVWSRFEMDTKTRLHYKDWKKTKPTSVVTLLLNKRIGDAILAAEERGQFEIQPLFEIKNEVKMGSMKASKFDELREILIDNNIRFAALHFTTACKNSVLNNCYGESFCRFVVDLKRHSTLEEAYQSRYDFNFVTVGPREITKQLGWLDGELYRDMKFESADRE